MNILSQKKLFLTICYLDPTIQLAFGHQNLTKY